MQFPRHRSFGHKEKVSVVQHTQADVPSTKTSSRKPNLDFKISVSSCTNTHSHFGLCQNDFPIVFLIRVPNHSNRAKDWGWTELVHSSAKGQCFLTKRLNSESNKKARHFKFLRGPICQPFSKMGNQNGINDERYVTHKKYYRETKRVSDILVIENVPEYQSATASAELGPHWSLESVVLDPRLFGVPASRPRRFILAFDKRKVRRVEGVSLGSTGHFVKHDHLILFQYHWNANILKLHPRTLADILEALIAQNVSSADMFLWMKCLPSMLSPAQVSWHQNRN